jgi:uncharacterized protein GlcG (DUF336 family)
MKLGVVRGTLTTETVQALLDAAAERARELDIKVHISIMDSSAESVGWLSFEGAPRLAATTARRKSFTAVNTAMPTSQWKAYTSNAPAEEQKIVDSIPDYIAADGGLPVVEDGVLLGGIGISGASQEADEDVAQHAVKAVGATTR